MVILMLLTFSLLEEGERGGLRKNKCSLLAVMKWI